MDTARWSWLLVLSAGCATRGGPAEPGPLSPNAIPPPPASVAGQSPLQTGPRQGVPIEGPTLVNAGGSQVSASPSTEPSVACRTDADCVPRECCHATACVALSSAPRCGETACTGECRPGSMDCGAGRCGCVAGQCSTQWVRVTPVTR